MKDPWVEKYRPKNLNDYIFSNEHTHDFFTKIIENEELPNLLISGIHGTGKSAIARIIINELGIKKNDVRIINASSDNGIANVRDRIDSFCKTLGMSSIRVVLLEEADGLSHSAQKALRSIMEDNYTNARFILTCNYPNKIIGPLHSRTQNIHIDVLDIDSLMERVAFILDNEKIVVDDIDILMNHINSYYPDMRKIINSIEQSSKTGKLVDIISKSSEANDISEWEKCWENSPNQDDLIGIIGDMELDDIDRIYRTMYDNVTNLPEDKVMNAIVIIAEHLYKSSFMSDQEINLMACIVSIFEND